MHIRPLRQYLYHGLLVAGFVVAAPTILAMTAMEDWVKGDKKLHTSIIDVVVGFGREFSGLMDDMKDMSYLDKGEGIDL